MAGGQRTEWTLDVQGLRDLSRVLRRADPESAKALKRAGREAGNIVRDHARTIAPRASGRLAKSIQTSVSGASVEVRAGSKRVPYAGPINFGWPAKSMASALAGSSSLYWRRRAPAVKGIQATHFLEQAVHEKWPVVKKTFEDGVRAVLESIDTTPGGNP